MRVKLTRLSAWVCAPCGNRWFDIHVRSNGTKSDRGAAKMSRPKKKNDIPDRWLNYSAVGKRIDGTRFIAFKVPLKQSLTRKLPGSEVFGPWELLDTLNKENLELGLVVDLTFTTRYYRPEDVPQSLLCVKIFTAGHEVPSDATILSFKRAVHKFLCDNRDNDKLIGVHCTHGVNRTGYLICRYMIDVDGVHPDKAVELFNSSRGHAIERQNYLRDLKFGPKRSNKGIEEPELEPVRGQATGRVSFKDPEYHRSSSPRGPNHHLPYGGPFPRPPLLPSPCRHSPPSASFHSGRWTSPHPDHHWSRPPPLRQSWSRHPQPVEQEWRPPGPPHVDRGRAAPPLFPRYTAHWTPVSRDDGGAEDWSWSRTRPPFRQRHGENRYNN